MSHFKHIFAVSTIALLISCAGDFETIGNEQRPGVTGNCNGKDYNTTLYNCVLGEIVGSCNGVNFYPEYQTCENGQIKEGVEISSSSSNNSSSSNSAFDATSGTFIDGRDSRTYKWVKIGTQIWMAENLNYDVPDDNSDMCLLNNPSNCNIYGKLYSWATAMALPSACNSGCAEQIIQPPHRGICPEGWHVPRDMEWDLLFNYAGGLSEAGRHLKSKTGWNTEGGYIAGADTYGFSALPGGNGSDTDGDIQRWRGYWWGWNNIDAGSASSGYSYSHIAQNNLNSITSYSITKANLISVRCVKNSM